MSVVPSIVGLNYLILTVWFGIVGLSYSFIIRLNLSYCNSPFDLTDLYNSSFSYHGITIVFFYLVPILFSALGN